jgi:hypothetical protein
LALSTTPGSGPGGVVENAKTVESLVVTLGHGVLQHEEYSLTALPDHCDFSVKSLRQLHSGVNRHHFRDQSREPIGTIRCAYGVPFHMT